MEENKEIIETEGAGAADESGQQKEKLFTQEQVNEIIKKRLAKVKQGESETDPEEFVRKTAELTARESRLSCREYLIEQDYPKELLEMLDTSDVKAFKEKADILENVYKTRSRKEMHVQPLGCGEYYADTGGPIERAFSPSRKHKPDTSRFGY